LWCTFSSPVEFLEGVGLMGDGPCTFWGIAGFGYSLSIYTHRPRQKPYNRAFTFPYFVSDIFGVA
jgi:hypothetical protein